MSYKESSEDKHTYKTHSHKCIQKHTDKNHEEIVYLSKRKNLYS